MRRYSSIALFLLLVCARELRATPIHALTVDDQQMLVPDDYDATQYYHLAPNFNNHIYFETLDDGTQRAWGFLDLNFATLIVWWNNSLHDESLYDDLGQSFTVGQTNNNVVGYTGATLGSSSLSETPSLTEGEVATPKVLLSIGLAKQLSQELAVGLCFQYGSYDFQGSLSGFSNGALNSSLPSSPAVYLRTNPYYNDLTVSSYSVQQYSSMLSFAPSVGISGERFSLDLKGEMLFNSVQNSYSESDFDSSGDTASIAQELQSNGPPSWDAMGRLRISVGDGDLVFRGAVQNWNLDLVHSLSGSFSGSGFSANQLAGYNQDDADERYNSWGFNGMVGWVESFKPVNGTLVVGLGVSDYWLTQNYYDYAPQSASNLNNLYLQSIDEYAGETTTVPFLMGGELALSKYFHVSASALYNILGDDDINASLETYGNGAVANSYSKYSSDSATPNDWDLNVGLGLRYESFALDVAVNSDFLGAESGFTQPIYESALSFGY